MMAIDVGTVRALAAAATEHGIARPDRMSQLRANSETMIPLLCDEIESLRTTARALAEALEQVWVYGDDDGNPVCAACDSHLDGEYAHRDGCLLATPAVRALLEEER